MTKEDLISAIQLRFKNLTTSYKIVTDKIDLSALSRLDYESRIDELESLLDFIKESENENT